MKRLLELFVDFVRFDFHRRTYLLIALWATALLVVNFTLELEDNYIDTLPTHGPRFIGYSILYSVAYFGALIIVSVSNPTCIKLANLSGKFWAVSLLGILILSADSGFVLHEYVLDWWTPPIRLRSFTFAVLSNASEFITIALPLFAINYWLIPNRVDNLGINNREMDLKPFFLILLIIAPFIYFSAYERGLSNYYPTYKFSLAEKEFVGAAWIPVFIYEFFYGLDFFNVELMFRGFMVIGLMQFLGRSVVLPMAVFYCSLHFGKPLAEAISSLFGGYVLGALAFQTRAIWGGVIVHMGLAWMMELSAFWVKNSLRDT